MALARFLETLVTQNVEPAEVIVVDASADGATRAVVTDVSTVLNISWQCATGIGAALQRNQGTAAATQLFILFSDDDVLLEPDCIVRLVRALEEDPHLGGVSAMITNQRYHPLGLATRGILRLVHSRRELSYAGRIVGPAINLLPDDREDLPEVVPVDWLNLGCTIYRREALPHPPFDVFFAGYSLMEDVALSLRVARRGWKLGNVRSARIVHDSQPTAEKDDVSAMAAMELINRCYIMTEVLDHRRLRDYLRLFVWEIFQIVACVGNNEHRPALGRMVLGKIRALRVLLLDRADGGHLKR